MIEVESLTIFEFRGIKELALSLNRKNFSVCGPKSLFEDLHRPSPSVSCSNTNSAWRGGVESRCGRTGIGRAMKRV